MNSQFLIFSLVAGSLGSLLERNACNADNCARAVTGTRYPASVQASHKADCSSFLMETITPATPTSTVTITPTSYSVVGSNAKRTAALLVKDNIEERNVALDSMLLPPTTTHPATLKARQVTQFPDSVPTYASCCSGTARYSSACSCYGVTVSTTYAPTPASKTITVYAAPSIIPVCIPTQNYGYNYLGGSIQNGVGLSLGAKALTPQACCASCWAEGSRCFVYEYYNNICYIAVETSGSLTPTDYCPYGVYKISTPGSGNFYGLGPCAHF